MLGCAPPKKTTQTITTNYERSHTYAPTHKEPSGAPQGRERRPADRVSTEVFNLLEGPPGPHKGRSEGPQSELWVVEPDDSESSSIASIAPGGATTTRPFSSGKHCLQRLSYRMGSGGFSPNTSNDRY